MIEDLQPRKETLTQLRLIGQKTQMSFSEDKTPDLWKNFMPKSKTIRERVNNVLYSVEVYDDHTFFDDFKPDRMFEKWAAVEMPDVDEWPEDMEELIIPEGLYAVFLLKGSGEESTGLYHYIFETWLPGSMYCLDNRPHLAIMGEKYAEDNPESEEEIWIPIRPRS